jgi:hypothetical protein
MAGEDSKGGASNSKSHTKSHHSKSHHDKSSRSETGTRATEDLYGMELRATAKKKKKKHGHHRPKLRPPTSFLALLCWDSWLPWPIDSEKTQVNKIAHKHKRSKKRTSQSGTSRRVQSWVQEVSSQATPAAPPISPTVASPAPSVPLPHSVSSSSGPQQEAEAAEAASNNGKNTARGAPTPCNAKISEKSRPRNNSVLVPLTYHSAHRHSRSFGAGERITDPTAGQYMQEAYGKEASSLADEDQRQRQVAEYWRQRREGQQRLQDEEHQRLMQRKMSNRSGHLASIRMPADRRPPSLSETERVYAQRTTDCVLKGNGPKRRGRWAVGQIIGSNY